MGLPGLYGRTEKLFQPAATEGALVGEAGKLGALLKVIVPSSQLLLEVIPMSTALEDAAGKYRRRVVRVTIVPLGMVPLKRR
jgi:hypothetical protein